MNRQNPGDPLALPIRTSGGFWLTGMSGNTRIQNVPKRLMQRVIARRATSVITASMCFKVSVAPAKTKGWDFLLFINRQLLPHVRPHMNNPFFRNAKALIDLGQKKKSTFVSPKSFCNVCLELSGHLV